MMFGIVTETLVGVVVALLVLTISFFKWKFQYWKRRNLPYLEPSIPFGNFAKALRGEEFIGFGHKKIYEEMKRRGWKHGGVYKLYKPVYMAIDLEFVKNIMVKDFKYFTDRPHYVNENDKLQAHLLKLRGNRWKHMRAKLSPTFTSGKIKQMFKLMTESQTDLEKKINEEYSKKKPINIKDVCSAFAANIIGSCAFGLEFNSFDDNNNTSVNKFQRGIFAYSKFGQFKEQFSSLFPEVAKLLNVTTSRKGTVEFITNLVQDTINYREKNNYARNDFMQLLIGLMKKKSSSDSAGEDEPLTLDEVASHAIVFFGAGFETSSSLMTFALYELAKHQDMQDRLRQEIVASYEKHHNEFTYESIMEMKYLNQVIDETTRLHATSSSLSRVCVEDYKIPGEDVIIEKGTTVVIPVIGIHLDPEYYPDPAKFDPERFNEKNKPLIPNYAHLPFGEGPRNCIGMRFGLLQSKMGLAALLRKYKFTVSEQTVEPLQYKPKTIILSLQNPIWLNAEEV